MKEGASCASGARTWWAEVLLLGVGLALALSRCGSDGARENGTAVAVLPLRNVSADASDTDYLAEGVSRAVITKLTQAGLRVTPWETARLYRDRDQRPELLAQELHVDAVLVGTFELAGDRILATLSLVDAESGLQSWAEEFETSYDDVFAVQRRIALGVATSLKRELTGEEQDALEAPESRSVEAYEQYLQGAHTFQEGSEESAGIAFQYFSKAIELDPELAEAHMAMGAVDYARYYFGWDGLSSLRRARSSYERALELEPASMRARRGLILVHYYEGRTEEILGQGELAARYGRDDDVETLRTLAYAYGFGVEQERALLLFRRILERNPSDEEARYQVVLASWDDYPEEAIAAGNEYVRRFGDDSELHHYVAYAYVLSEDLEGARRHYDLAIDPPLGEPSLEARVYGGILYDELGERREAEAIWRRGLALVEPRLEAHPDNLRMRVFTACYRGLLGEEEAILREGERVVSEGLASDDLQYLMSVLMRLGKGDAAVRLGRSMLRAGFVVRPDIARPKLAFATLDTEDYRRYQAELEAEQARLRARYDF